ncbi:GNAT family N-acetyltransferase [Arthrobacter antibioticus]|uniref:GNAT family N-acetyltransferase n=1 Tax=Arthrobacter sp. H35-MC1 TaxID=3046203 RepID=UPI0024B8BC21|nr:GNAT family N-acetyltransferase [Arthrobacter sp. H35-MC1]MDJ0315619.1 GNAT family N-acetyltransferase [Arthrobacter sp. H35-MC1]
MAAFNVLTSAEVSNHEILSLYDSVGWIAYTNDPDLLFRAISNSSFVVTAHNGTGQLIGLARAISDDSTICYLQDILVRPEFQNTGVGRALIDHVQQRYHHVRQTVLITDDEPKQRAFYQSLGMVEGSNVIPNAVHVFVHFR